MGFAERNCIHHDQSMTHTHHNCGKGKKIIFFPLSRNSEQVKAVTPVFANLTLPSSHPSIIAQFAGPRQDLERRGQLWIDSCDLMLPDCSPKPPPVETQFNKAHGMLDVIWIVLETPKLLRNSDQSLVFRKGKLNGLIFFFWREQIICES